MNKKNNPRSVFSDVIFIIKVFFALIKVHFGFRIKMPCVSVFGSAKFQAHSSHYQSTLSITKAIAELGFGIITGGGPGIMEAANKAAKNSAAPSFGCNIILPFENKSNVYLDKAMSTKYFFVRKIMLINHSCAFLIMPGGFGTLDEFFELTTLMSTKKILTAPIIVFNALYHQYLIAYIEHLVNEGAVLKSDISHIHFVDEESEVISILKKIPIKMKTSLA